MKATHWAMQDASRPIDLFKKGHRIRIAVMNALDNYYFPNSNTGGDEGTARHTVIGTMRIHHSADYPSHVSLPVLSH